MDWQKATQSNEGKFEGISPYLTNKNSVVGLHYFVLQLLITKWMYSLAARFT